ncbi:MAG: alcohol dehydrogenase catalytic domain-containing protein [Candidatus Omnitrophica bacterium]|nr:alcohol dehydrogenase catalytic domain-containing protein [Candidatus Omnitrophota bacterium]
MRVVRLLKPYEFQISEEDAPSPGREEVLVQSQSVGVCASDIHYYKHGGIGDARPRGPIILGHEPMGRIVDVGEGVGSDWIGKRVAIEPGIPCFECEHCLSGNLNLCPNVRFFGSPPIDGAFREKFCHPACLVEPVPDDFSDEMGAILEPLGVAIHAVDLIQPKTGVSTVVVGCGAIGLCTIAMLRAAGASPIYAVDPLEYRTEIALQVGATQVIAKEGKEAVEEILSLTEGKGCPTAFEAAGYASAHQPTLDMASIGAKVMIIGISAENHVSFEEGRARRKGLTIYMCRRSRNTLKRGIELISSGRIDLSPLVTHHFNLDQVTDAFETAANYRDGVIKAVVHPSD